MNPISRKSICRNVVCWMGILMANLLIISCNRDIDDNKDPEPKPQPEPQMQENIFENVVTVEDNAIASSKCDVEKGDYVLTFKEEVPEIKAGSVVTVTEGHTHRIVLVTKATTNGKTVTMKGHEGDITYLFHDTSFYLSTNGAYDKLASNLITKADKDIAPVFDTTFTLFDRTYGPYKKDVIRKDDTNYISLDFTSKMNLDFLAKFEFGAPIEHWFDDIKFLAAGNYNAQFLFVGNIDNTFHADAEWQSQVTIVDKGSDNSPYTLLENNFFGDKYIAFTISGVPVWLDIVGDIYSQSDVTLGGKLGAHLTVENHIDGSFGLEHIINAKGEGSFDVIHTFNSEWPKPVLDINGQLSANWKFSIFPVISVYIYSVAGPAIAIKPVIDNTMGFGFKTDLFKKDLDQDYYLSTSLETLGQIDIEFGFSTPVFFGSDIYMEAWEPKKSWTVIKPATILKSPTGLEIESISSNDVVKGEAINIDYKVLATYFGLTGKSILPSILKIDSNTFAEYLPVNLGHAQYSWTPQSNDDFLRATVYNYTGEVVGQQVIGTIPNIIISHPADGTSYNLIDQSVDLKWTDESRTAGKNIYNIYYGLSDKKDEMKLLGSTPANSAQIFPPAKGKYYWYVESISPEGERNLSRVNSFNVLTVYYSSTAQRIFIGGPGYDPSGSGISSGGPGYDSGHSGGVNGAGSGYGQNNSGFITAKGNGYGDGN